MARVTVEDCVDKIPNRFELVMLASQRARKIGSGASLTVPRDNDKNPVVALREIAEQTVNNENLKEEVIRAHQRTAAFETEEETIDLMDGEKEWEEMAQRAARAAKIYGEDDIADDDVAEEEEAEDEEPSLEDLAGLPADE